MGCPVVILHGASSAGKSTLARALQAAAPFPFWHVSIDHLRDAGILPMARYRSGAFDWTADRAQVFDGLHALMGATAKAGNALIIEHIFDTPGWLDDLRGHLTGQDVLFVGLHCAPDILQAREQARGDRPLDDALRDHARVHLGQRYDLELDGAADPAKNAQAILTALRSGMRKSTFAGP